MDADTGKEPFVRMRELDGFLRGCERVAHIDAAPHARRPRAGDGIRDVVREFVIVEMRVRVDELDVFYRLCLVSIRVFRREWHDVVAFFLPHQRTSVPAGILTSTTLRSLPSLAARIMPSESWPRILRGLRFATSTRCLPTSSSGL